MNKSGYPGITLVLIFVGMIITLFTIYDFLKRLKYYWKLKTSAEDNEFDSVYTIIMIFFEFIFLLVFGGVFILSFVTIFTGG